MLDSHFYYMSPFSAWQIPGYDIELRMRVKNHCYCRIGEKHVAMQRKKRYNEYKRVQKSACNFFMHLQLMILG